MIAPEFRAAQQDRYMARADDAFHEVEGRWRTYQRKAQIIAAAFRSATPQRGDAALEVGCGSGILTRLVANLVPDRRLVGTDFSPTMLETARVVCAGCANVEFRAHDIYSPWPGDADLAFAFGCDIIHHLDNPVGALSNVHRALRPGGRILFLESNPRNPVLWLRLRGRDEERRVFLNSERTLAAWATAAGFVDVELALLPFHLPNGPRPLGRLLDLLEDEVCHRGPLRHRAALFGLSAQKPGSTR